MQVPEKLALIGGSILLSSTLIFTLKSQASSIIPSVGHSISHVFDHIGDAQKSSDFDNNFKQAQKNGETTGRWGTSKYYIDKGNNMHIGKGTLQSKLADIVGDSKLKSLKTVSIDQPIKAPQDSSFLFSGQSNDDYNSNPSITSFNGLDNVDTSQVTNMHGIFAHNESIDGLDLSSWDTSKVTNLQRAFDFDHALKQINVSDWNVSNVTNMGEMFGDDFELNSLDLSHWQDNKLNTMGYMFNQDFKLPALNISKLDMSKVTYRDSIFGRNYTLSKIDLGDKSNVDHTTALPSPFWTQNGKTVNDDSQLTAGTWTKAEQSIPNLAPVTSDDYQGGYNDRWEIPVQAGKTYYVSAHVNSGYEAFETKSGPNTQFVGKDHGTFIAKFTSDRDSTMHIGFGYGDYGNSHISLDKLTITQSDSYVPFEKTAQQQNVH